MPTWLTGLGGRLLSGSKWVRILPSVPMEGDSVVVLTLVANQRARRKAGEVRLLRPPPI